MLKISKNIKVIWNGREVKVNKYSDNVYTFSLDQRRNGGILLDKGCADFNLLVTKPIFIGANSYMPSGTKYLLEDLGKISLINIDEEYVIGASGEKISISDRRRDGRIIAQFMLLKANGYV